ncbi:hypothetical protein QYG89_09885 [Bacillus sp. B190/17]|uniref:Uncharacterized protein n=1 Tax=Bacillus lumedeiriae TaxID=3058829 RepID=A0ABW8I910_9BACI
MKKIISCFLVLALVFGSLSSAALQSDSHVSAAAKVPKGYKSISKSYSGAIVHKVLTDKQARWSQDNYYVYMKPKEARAFAGRLEMSAKKQVAWYFASIFAGPYGAILSGGVLAASLNRSAIANDIRAQSEKGPVKLVIIKNRYNTMTGNVKAWDGKYVDVKSSKIEKYKSIEYLKPKKK